MFGKTGLKVLVAVILLGILSGGCAAPKQGLGLKFAPEQTSTYKVTTEMAKESKFDQPSVNKFRQEKVGVNFEMIFDQTVKSVDTAGNATAEIKIKQLKYNDTSPKGAGYDFDSARKNNRDKSLKALMGKRYTIKISPDGKAEAADVKDIRGAIQQGPAAKITANFFSDEAIKNRHSIPALVAMGSVKEMKVGDTWSVLKASPSGMLIPKSYEKIYKLKEIKSRGGEQVAVIEMNAMTSSKPASDTVKEESSAAAFSKMFQSSDTYTGELVLNLTTGKVEKSDEGLQALWVASEDEATQKSDKGADVITMGFSHRQSIEKVK